MTFDPTSWPGGGSGVGPSCVLLRETAVSIRAAGAVTLQWDGLVDDIYNQTILTSLPSGLGLTASFNGTSAVMTTTASGVWAFTLFISSPDAADATLRGTSFVPFGGGASPFGPIQADGDFPGLTVIYALPSGATGQVTIVTATPATANPYRASGSLCISRLA